MNVSMFEWIKESVGIQQAARTYGHEPNWKGYIKCPFHRGGNERTPSMILKPRYFKCYACGKFGTVIDFVMELFNLTREDACIRLNEDFHLGLDLSASSPESKKAIEQRREDEELRKAFFVWENKAYTTLTDYYRELRADMWAYRPNNTAMLICKRYADAARKIDCIEYLVDCLLYGELKDKIQFYKDYRGEIARYENRRNRTA